MQILVGTNETPAAAAAARWAADLAHATRSTITIAEVFEPQEAERSPEHAAEIRRHNTRQLAEWARTVGLADSVAVALEGAPLPVLAARTQRANVDMIVIGSKPYEGATRLGLGSLAHTLVHHLSCALIVVPDVDASVVGGRIIVVDDGAEGSQAAMQWSKALARQVGAGVSTSRGAGHDPAQSLRDHAEHLDAALLVVAARSEHSLHGHLLGSVPDALLHHPTRPVAVLPYGLQVRSQCQALSTSLHR